MAARIALAEVHSFDQQGRACFATNAHFAQLLQLSESGARKVITKLVDSGHLIREVTADGQGAHVRTLRPAAVTPPPEMGHPPARDGAHIRTTTKTTTKTEKARKPRDLQEVVDAFTQFGAPDEAAPFFDHYEANGWKQGRGSGRPIQNWKAAARAWIRRAPQFAQNGKQKFDPQNIDAEALRRWADQ